MATLTASEELSKLQKDTAFAGGTFYGRTPKGIVDLKTGSMVTPGVSPAPAPSSTANNAPPIDPVNPIAASGIRRETGGASYATEAERLMGGLDTSPLTETERQKIRDEQLRIVRGQLDAIDTSTASMLASEAVRGVDRLGRGRAISARSGVLTSDMGDRRTREIQDLNAQNEQAIRAAADEKKRLIMAGAEQRAVDLIEAETNRTLKNTDTYLSFLANKQQEARGDIKALATAGVTLDKLSSDEYTKLLTQSGYDKFVFDAVYNSQLPANQKQDFEYVNLGNGKVVRFNKKGGTPEYFDYSIPEGFEFKMAGDIPVFVNSKTQEVKIAAPNGDQSKLGDFAKETELDTFTDAQGNRISTLYNPITKKTRQVNLGKAQRPEGDKYTGFEGFSTKPQSISIEAVLRYIQDQGVSSGASGEQIAGDLARAKKDEGFFYSVLNTILSDTDTASQYYRPTTIGVPAGYYTPPSPTPSRRTGQDNG